MTDHLVQAEVLMDRQNSIGAMGDPWNLSPNLLITFYHNIGHILLKQNYSTKPTEVADSKFEYFLKDVYLSVTLSVPLSAADSIYYS